jgi:hypothetical protein
MFARDLHVILAIFTIITALAATIEGCIRAIKGSPEGIAAIKTRSAVLLSVAMTATAGLGLLVTGHSPHEWLHLVYASLAFGLIPVADNAASSLDSNRGKALSRFGGGIVCLVVLTRLFATG